MHAVLQGNCRAGAQKPDSPRGPRTHAHARSPCARAAHARGRRCARDGVSLTPTGSPWFQVLECTISPVKATGWGKGGGHLSHRASGTTCAAPPAALAGRGGRRKTQGRRQLVDAPALQLAGRRRATSTLLLLLLSAAASVAPGLAAPTPQWQQQEEERVAEIHQLRDTIHRLPAAEASRRFAALRPRQSPPPRQDKIDHFVLLWAPFHHKTNGKTSPFPPSPWPLLARGLHPCDNSSIRSLVSGRVPVCFVVQTYATEPPRPRAARSCRGA